MTAVVFSGPSIDHRSVARLVDARVMPPVARGDIDRLLAADRPPERIGIIDGRFLQSFALSPKEILRAIDRRVVVYGSASMGALRAVECEPFGMRGVGRIFEEFQSGRTNRDDEVAMTYCATTLRPLSEPLITMRFAVRQAVRDGVVSARTATRFVAIAGELYFPHRTVRAVMQVLEREVAAKEADRLRAFFAAGPPDAKREDAVAMLRRMDLDGRSG